MMYLNKLNKICESPCNQWLGLLHFNQMIYYKSAEEIELIRQSCLIVSAALARVAELLRPGITGLEIDAAAEQVITRPWCGTWI